MVCRHDRRGAAQPFHCLSTAFPLPFLCLSTAFPPTFHCLSSTFHCLCLDLPPPFQVAFYDFAMSEADVEALYAREAEDPSDPNHDHVPEPDAYTTSAGRCGSRSGSGSHLSPALRCPCAVLSLAFRWPFRWPFRCPFAGLFASLSLAFRWSFHCPFTDLFAAFSLPFQMRLSQRQLPDPPAARRPPAAAHSAGLHGLLRT